MTISRLMKSLIPLLVFAGIAVFLLKGLNRNPHSVPSTLIGKPVPALQGVDPNIFKGHVTVLNVFASWCAYCRAEHPILMDMARDKNIRLVGLNYKNKETNAKAFLKKYGNPYEKVIEDPKGRLAMDLGVYGAPETFVIDKKGVVRYKHVGPVSANDWKDKLAPVLKQLDGEK